MAAERDLPPRQLTREQALDLAVQRVIQSFGCDLRTGPYHALSGWLPDFPRHARAEFRRIMAEQR